MSAPPDIVLWDGDAADAPSWSVNAASGSSATVSTDAGAHGAGLRLGAAGNASLRFAFDLVGHRAWAIARREGAFVLPAHYVVSAYVRGDAPPLELQVKLVDPSGASVWWWRRRGFTPSPAGQRLVFHRASLELAWGPAGVDRPDRVGAVEIAVAAERHARRHRKSTEGETNELRPVRSRHEEPA